MLNPISSNQYESIVDLFLTKSNKVNLFESYNLSNLYSFKSLSDYPNIYILYSSSIINDVLISKYSNDTKTIDYTDVLIDNDDVISSQFNDKFPLFFTNNNIIKIPSKVARTLQKHIPTHLLKEIHPKKDVAIEMCLILTTQLTSTYFGVKDGSNPEGWKSLHAKYLRELISLHPMAYKKVIQVLKYRLNTGPIIECDDKYIIGEKNLFYRLGPSYIGKGIVKYVLKTNEAIKGLNRHYYRQFASAIQNPICKNLINLYSEIELPNIEEIKKEAKRLIKSDGGYFTKKGKRLKFLNKHTRSYFTDASKYSFVEDAIEIFEYLTKDGLMIPTEGSINAGGRVVDSFTLMPSWIRKLIRIGNKTLHECDYAALHPNIAICLYGGASEYINHADVQLELNLDLLQVKVEHLSFFNKKVWQMKQSPLFDYYQNKESKMIENIIWEKQFNSEIKRKKDKHKITSRRMFNKEVEIMTDVIEQLNQDGINVLYVYDALLSEPQHTLKVLEVMNETVLKHGVKTSAKQSSYRIQNNSELNIIVDKMTA